MNAFNARGVAFATKTAAAALAAMLLALWFQLPNPGWAGLTVFLTSQQLDGAAGAVVSRSVYRALGTAVVFAGTLVVIPSLVAAPELLVAGIAAWVAACLYLSLLDRSPRSYVFLLAAYTVPLVGLPLANNPSGIFDVALWRAEEIGLGGLLSVTVHTVFAPRSLRPALAARLQAAVAQAQGWILQALGPEPASAAQRRARDRFGSTLAELRNLAAHLPFEPRVPPHELATVIALEERLVALLPLLAEVEDRIAEVRADQAPPAAWIDAHLEAVRARVEPTPRPPQATASATPPEHGTPPLLAVGALERLAELAATWDACRALLRHLQDASDIPDDATRRLLAGATRRALHVDHGLAAWSAFAAAAAVAATGALCWLLGWDQGGGAIAFAAACSSLSATLDDPRPALRAMLAASVLAVPVGALYVFAILPALDGPFMLAAALAPLFFLIALLLATPLRLPATFFALVTLSLASIQSVQSADFWSFTPTAVGVVLGTLVASMAMSLLRVIGAETSVRRLLRAAERDLATMAAAPGRLSRAAWSSRMVDRIALLLPRMARTSAAMQACAGHTLDDLRIGLNLLDLREARRAADAPARAAIDGALREVASHFRSRLARPDAAPAPGIRVAIDHAIAALASAAPGAARVQALTAATGLRLGLFPARDRDAPALEVAR